MLDVLSHEPQICQIDVKASSRRLDISLLKHPGSGIAAGLKVLHRDV